MEIQGKVAIITGASGGIGLSTARLFAEKGAKVVMAARSKEKLDHTAAELNQKGYQALAVQADMRNKEDVQRLVDAAEQHFGRIDILVNNAGQAMAGRVADLSLDDFHQIYDLNVLGPIYAIQAAAPKMRQAGGGIILNISSMVSKMSIPGLSGYASSKAALNQLSQTARVELAQDNIRVITVFPRMTATDFGKNSLGNREMRQSQRSRTEDIPVDSPEYVAEKILQAVQSEPAEQYME